MHTTHQFIRIMAKFSGRTAPLRKTGHLFSDITWNFCIPPIYLYCRSFTMSLVCCLIRLLVTHWIQSDFFHAHIYCTAIQNVMECPIARLHCSHNSEMRFVSVLSCVFVFIHERCTSSCCVRLSLANCSQTRWNWLSYNITLFHDVCTHSMKWGGNERIDFSYSAVFVYQYQQRIRLLMWQTFQSLCVFGEGQESFPTLCSGVAKYFEKRNAI